MAKRNENAPLDAIRLLLKDHSMTLQPLINQVSAIPTDPQLEFYFVPAQFMAFYRPYHRPGQPFKNLKLVNFELPAISLNFYSKHKYKIDRDASVTVAINHLTEQRQQLLTRSFLSGLTALQQQELRKIDQLLQQIRQKPELFEFCFSNYHHYYMYWYCVYRYFEDDAKLKTSSGTEHLLKYTERVEGQIHERLNIIFVDPYYITKPVPQDNKLIDRELANYPNQFKQGITTLYLRKKHS